MIYDYWASYSLVLESDSRQQEIINYLLGSGKLANFPEVPDVSARLELAAQAVGTRLKEYARVGSARQPGGYFGLLRQTENLKAYFKGVQAQLQGLGLLPQLPDLGGFPAGSFTLHFTFTLKTPYLSKDDSPFQLFDNPMRKEWVFKLPYIAPSQWKGALQATMVKQLVEWWQSLPQQQRTQRKQFVAQRIQLTRLFGTEIESVQHYLTLCGDNKLEQSYKRYVRRFQSETGFLAGRLYFYPSFFDQLDLEVINPHDRETGAGTLPIYLEVVPAGATATFTLLYVPTDKNPKQNVDHLSLVAEGLQAMFNTYGFGAKTSSGFGLADANQGSFVLNLPDQTNIQHLPRPKEPQEPVKPVALQSHLTNFPHKDFSLKPDEWRKKHNATNSQRETYKNARAIHSEYQQALTSYNQATEDYQQKLADWEKKTNTPPAPQTQRAFTSLETLKEQITTIAQNKGM